MAKFSRIHFAAALLFCGEILVVPSRAQAKVDSSPKKTKLEGGVVENLGSTEGVLEGYLKFFPGAKCLVKDFLGIVRPKDYGTGASVMMSNNGLSNFYKQKAEENPQFYQTALDFYQDTMNVAAGEASPGGGERPYFFEEAGGAEHENLKPGWLWDLAMKHSGNNANDAMRMIGICGHDNVVQGEMPPVPMSPEVQEKKIAELKEEIRSKLESIEKAERKPDDSASCMVYLYWETGPKAHTVSNIELANLEPDDLKGLSSEKIRELLDTASYCPLEKKAPKFVSIMRQYREEGIDPTIFKNPSFACPSWNDLPNFYLPKSLGEKADLPLEEKKEIERAKYEKSADCAGGSCLPSKHYHVVGAAAVACELIAEGHHPSVVTELSAASGTAYRVIWLNQTLSQCPLNDPINEPVSKDQTEGYLAAIKHVFQLGVKLPPCPPNPPPPPESPVGDFYDNKDQLCDAAKLLRMWTMSGDFGSAIGKMYTTVPNISTAARKFIVDDLSDDIDLNRFGLEGSRPTGWSETRYQKAKTIYDSIMADFRWTTDQHRIGAQFAATVCKPDPKRIAESSCAKK